MLNSFFSRSLRVALPAAILALLAGCASSPPTPKVDYKDDYDFSGIKTLAFMSHSGASSGDSPRAFLSDMVIERIDRGITNAIENKGMKIVKDPRQADALINWHLVANEKTDVRSYNTGPSTGVYYGGARGYNRMAMYNCWNCGGSDVMVRNYTQGTFIVDIIEPDLNRSVWRSTTQSKLKGDEPSRDQADYDAAAARIMAGFPPY